MRRYLITGGAGFVGANLVRALLDKTTDELHLLLKPETNLWRLQDLSSPERVQFHDVDLLDRKKLIRAIKKIQPAIIYHLAARGAYPEQNDPEDILTNNVIGTLYLFEALKDVPFELLVQLGSSSEYGRKDQPMKESDSLEPNSYYAISKATTSWLARFWAEAYRKPIVTIRLFSVYGPYEAPTRLFPQLFINFSDNRRQRLASKDIAHDFVYVDDVVALLMSVESLRQFVGESFNLGTGQEVTLAKVVETLEWVTGKKLQAGWGELPARPWDSTHWVAEMSKTQRLLHWQPRLSLAEGIAKYWQWWQRNRQLYVSG